MYMNAYCIYYYTPLQIIDFRKDTVENGNVCYRLYTCIVNIKYANKLYIGIQHI